MTDAPERILVRTDYDGTHDGTWITASLYEPPIEYTGMEPQYIRTDTHDNIVKAADNIEGWLIAILDMHGLSYTSATEALTAYRKAKGKNK